MEKQNLTIWQKLSKTFGPNSLLGMDQPSVKLDKNVLLKTTDKTQYDKEKLEYQQSLFLSNQWQKIENNLYAQAIYYEPNRIAAFYDYESMEFCVFGDTKIATPDGFITIKELADKGRDYEFITYAYDHNLKKVVPALARNAHYTRDEMTYKITFDDNSHIIATWEHQFMKRDGSFERVMNLKPGDSMMPFYRKSFYNNEKYNWVYTCNSEEGHNGWVSEHNLIAEWSYDRKINEDEEVHHIDFNGKNNKPENLQIMNISEHRAYHARLNNEKLWANPEYRQKMAEVAKRTGEHSWGGTRAGKNNPAYIPIDFDLLIETAKTYGKQETCAEILKISCAKIIDEIRLYGYTDWNDFKTKHNITFKINEKEERHIPWDNILYAAKEKNTLDATAKYLGITRRKLEYTLQKNGYKTWGIFMEAYGMEKSKPGRRKTDEVVVNHKIVSIEPYGVVPVYDLTVPGYKNFATDTIFSHNTPEISTALDIYSEESTTPNQDGYVLQIYSESKRIKSILADLFNNILDININLPMWIRNTCKYGDNFVYLKLDEEKGITGCLQLPNIEIERLERGMSVRTMNAVVSSPTPSDVNSKGLRFVWKTKDMEFNTWEMAHFRLLGDDRKLPYGTSMLEKARRVWKQLVLAEDAMLIYRTSRAPERRVFKVFVGNMDDKDVEPYVQRVANKFKRDQVVDSKTGNVDMRYNQMAVDQDYFIPVRDPGQTMPIETLPGAQNLSEIADIEYIQKKLLTALRIPKAFLGFEEPVGSGDNLSLMDIRFARTINKIQKSMIAELNKIAIIHLFILGFEDELNNFTLGLTNPSKQADLLMVSVWKEKVLLYKDLVSEIPNTLQPTSATWAKKHIFGFSDEDIKLEIQQIRLERAVAAELTNTPTIITHTGMFDIVDKLYKTASGDTTTAPPPAEGGMPPPPPAEGGGMGDMPPPPPSGGEAPLMDSVEKSNYNILVESNDLEADDFIDLSKGRNSLGLIEKELDKLLNG
jgi:intein/homing endonuclease